MSLSEGLELLNTQLLRQQSFRMSLTSENTLNRDNEDICYKGEKKQEWLDAVAALNNLHTKVYPKVKEQKFRWSTSRFPTSQRT